MTASSTRCPAASLQGAPDQDVDPGSVSWGSDGLHFIRDRGPPSEPRPVLRDGPHRVADSEDSYVPFICGLSGLSSTARAANQGQRELLG